MLKFGSPNFSFLLFCLFLYQLLTSVPPLVKFGSPNFTPLLTSSVAPLSLHKHFSGENHFNYLSISTILPAVQNRCGSELTATRIFEVQGWLPPEGVCPNWRAPAALFYLQTMLMLLLHFLQLTTPILWPPTPTPATPYQLHPPWVPPHPPPPRGTPPRPIGKGEGNGDYSDWLVKSGRGNHNNHSGSAHLSWLQSIFSRFCN